MFLVDNHKTEVLERKEDGATRTKDDIVWVTGKLLLPDLNALRIGIFGVIDAQPVAEDTLQPFHNLHSQGNLWQQIEHLLFTF